MSVTKRWKKKKKRKKKKEHWKEIFFFLSIESINYVIANYGSTQIKKRKEKCEKKKKATKTHLLLKLRKISTLVE